MIKEAMDKKFGAPWHAVVGEGFELTRSVKNLLYMFFAGNMAICVSDKSRVTVCVSNTIQVMK